MSKHKVSNLTENIQDLRADLLVEDSSVAAPKAAWQRKVSLDPAHARQLKKHAVRALIFALTLVMATQLVYHMALLPRTFRGGPVAMETAVGQLEDDLLPPPAPPPSLRP